MSTASRPRPSFGTTKRYIVAVLLRAQAMYAGFEAFTSLPITMVAFLALITALANAQTNALTLKTRGLAALRNTKRDALWTAMGILSAYVQGLADTMSAENASSLIQSAGLVVAGTGARAKAILTATLTPAPGVVHLVANASLLAGKAAKSKRLTFNWEWSSDGGKTWNDAGSTPHANTDVTGLTLMTTYSFRVSVTTAKAAGAWSQAVGLLVH
jgi:hypothetical protein